MNQASEKARNLNLLNSKTKNFRENIKISEDRANSHSAIHQLAGKLYSKSSNKHFNPDKMSNSKVSRASSAKSSRTSHSAMNPELSKNEAILGLSMRASHVSSFAELNTQLLVEKKELESLILMLRQGIAKEKKKLNTAEHNGSQHSNDCQKFYSFYEQAHSKSIRLNEDIGDVKQQISSLQKNLKSLRSKINKKKADISAEQMNVKNLNKHTKLLKREGMREEKEKNELKVDLSKQQKTMNSASIYLKELENEKAMLLLEINNYVSAHKL